MPASLTIGALDLADDLIGRLAANHTVIAWSSRGAPRTAPLSSSVSRASSVASACTAPIVISAFPDDATLAAVTEAPDGMLTSLGDDAIHVACGLHGRAAIDSASRAHDGRGQRFVAAPILLAAGANQHTATILGGAADSVATVRSLFEAIGISIAAVCEQPGDAALLATAHAAMVASAMEAIAEAFALVRKYGVDPVVMRDVMSETLFAGSVYPRLADAMLGRSDDRAPSAVRAVQIVDLAFESANAAHVPLPGLDACRDRLLSAIADGAGERAWTVVAHEQARASGLE